MWPLRPQFAVPHINRWGAWGRQRGVDLTKVAEPPDIHGLVCETCRSLAVGLDSFVAENARITRAAGEQMFVARIKQYKENAAYRIASRPALMA
jgi:hypothetical protein